MKHKMTLTDVPADPADHRAMAPGASGACAAKLDALTIPPDPINGGVALTIDGQQQNLLCVAASGYAHRGTCL